MPAPKDPERRAEWIRKNAEWHRGRSHGGGPKISAALKDVPKSPEHRAKLSQALMGHSVSQETRDKISSANRGHVSPMRGRRHSVESNRRNSEKHKGKTLPDECKRKLSEVRRSPEYRQRNAENGRAQWQRLSVEERRQWMEMRFGHLSSAQTSSIENMVASAMDECGVVYLRQVRIGPYSADLFLPNSNVVVECDGEYWHSTGRARDRDARRDTFMAQRGHGVVRLGERAIRRNPKDCLLRGLLLLQLRSLVARQPFRG